MSWLKLIDERNRFKSNLTKFKNFYDIYERIISAGSFQKRLNRNVILINKFEILQDRIESLIVSTADEEAHH